MTSSERRYYQPSEVMSKMSKLPKFANDQEEAEFWDTHDSADFLDDTEPVAAGPGTDLISLGTRVLLHPFKPPTVMPLTK